MGGCISAETHVAKSIVMSKIKYIREDPDTRLPEMLDSARKIDRRGRFDSAFDMFEPIAKDRIPLKRSYR